MTTKTKTSQYLMLPIPSCTYTETAGSQYWEISREQSRKKSYKYKIELIERNYTHMLFVTLTSFLLKTTYRQIDSISMKCLCVSYDVSAVINCPGYPRNSVGSIISLLKARVE